MRFPTKIRIAKTISSRKMSALLLSLVLSFSVLLSGCYKIDDSSSTSTTTSGISTFSVNDITTTKTPDNSTVTSGESTVVTTIPDTQTTPSSTSKVSDKTTISQKTTVASDTKNTEKTTTTKTTTTQKTTTTKKDTPTVPTNENEYVDGFSKLLDYAEIANYDNILNGLNNFNSNFTIQIKSGSGLTVENYVNELSNYALYSTGTAQRYSYTTKINNLYTEHVIKPKYEDYMTEKLFNKNKNELKNKVKEIVATVNPDDSQYKQIMTIHNYLVNNITYTSTGKYIYTAYGALVEGKAVCQGYALGLQLLCNSVGIESILVSGSIKETGELHMWNKVKIDGEWYNIDSTWDDPTGHNLPGYISYAYFNITDAELGKTHIPKANLLINVPKATSTTSNYYTKQKRVIDTNSLSEDEIISKVRSIIKADVAYYKNNPASANKYSRIKFTGSNASKVLKTIVGTHFAELGNTRSYMIDENKYTISYILS